MSASALPVSLSEISRKSTIATASIGRITIRTKNRRSRARKLMQTGCLHYEPDLGAIAQLGERLDRTQEVGGSSPPSSIPEIPAVEPRMALPPINDSSAPGAGGKQGSSITVTVAPATPRFVTFAQPVPSPSGRMLGDATTLTP